MRGSFGRGVTSRSGRGGSGAGRRGAVRPEEKRPFLDMFCMRKIKRPEGVGPLVSSQERRASVVPPISRSSTGYRVLRFGLHRDFFVRDSGNKCRTIVFDALKVKNESSCPGHSAPPRLRPAPPRRSAVLRRARPRPWNVRVFDSAGSYSSSPIPRPTLAAFSGVAIFTFDFETRNRSGDRDRLSTRCPSCPGYPLMDRVL